LNKVYIHSKDKVFFAVCSNKIKDQELEIGYTYLIGVIDFNKAEIMGLAFMTDKDAGWFVARREWDKPNDSITIMVFFKEKDVYTKRWTITNNLFDDKPPVQSLHDSEMSPINFKPVDFEQNNTPTATWIKPD